MGVTISLKVAEQKFERYQSIVNVKESKTVHEWCKDYVMFDMITGLYKANVTGDMTHDSIFVVDKETLEYIIHIITKNINAMKQMREGEGDIKPYEEEGNLKENLEVFNLIKNLNFDKHTLFFCLE